MSKRNTVEITIKAFDMATNVFKKIGKNAEQSMKNAERATRNVERSTSSLSSSFSSVATNVGKSLSSIGTGMTNVGKSIENVGKSATKAMAPVYALGSLVGGLGLKRAMEAERVGVMFDVIYDNAKDAEKAGEKVQKIVKGTRYGLNEIADPFLQLKSTGVSDKTGITAMLANMNLASMKGDPQLVERLTSLQQSALAMGRIDATMINSFASAFVDVPLIVGNALGKTKEETREFLSEGAYDVEEIMNIINDGVLNGSKGVNGSTKALGEMIQREGDTLTGIFANTFAAMARAGQKLWEESGAFDNLKEALNTVIDAFDNNIDTFIPIATAASDAFVWLINIIKEVVLWFQNLSPSTQQFIAKLGVLAMSFGPVMMVLGRFLTVGGNVFGFLGRISGGFGRFIGLIGRTGGNLVRLRGLFSVLTGPIGIVIAIIGTLIGVFVRMYQMNDEFRNKVNTVWEAIKEKISIVITAISEFVKEIFGEVVEWWNNNQEMIKEATSNVWGWIKSFLSTTFDVIVSIFQFVWPFIEMLIVDTWNSIKNVIQGAINIILGIVQAFSTLFSGNWSALWEGIKQIFSGVIQTIWGLINLWLVGKILGVARRFAGLFKGIFNTVWNAIKSIFTGSINIIKNVVSTGFGIVRNVITTIFNSIRSVTSSVWNGIRNVVMTVVNRLRTGITSAFNKIKSGIERVWNGIKSTTSRVWNSMVGIVKAPINLIIGAINGMINGLNKLKIKSPKIPSWVPKFGGKSFEIGFNIPNIPSLATGGVVSRPTLAMVGDAGRGNPEIVAPQKMLREIIASELGSLKVSGSNITDEQIIIILRKILRAILNKNETIDYDLLGKTLAKYLRFEFNMDGEKVTEIVNIHNAVNDVINKF